MKYPILESKTYRKKNPRGTHTIKVWPCPLDRTKYSFSIAYGNGVAAFNEFPENPYLSGCFEKASEALNAGIEEAQK